MNKFCDWHIKTVENNTDCSAHLHESRCFPCPYKDAKVAKDKCSDFEFDSIFVKKFIEECDQHSGSFIPNNKCSECIVAHLCLV